MRLKTTVNSQGKGKKHVQAKFVRPEDDKSHFHFYEMSKPQGHLCIYGSCVFLCMQGQRSH